MCLVGVGVGVCDSMQCSDPAIQVRSKYNDLMAEDLRVVPQMETRVKD